MLRRRTERATVGTDSRRIRLVQLLGLHHEAAVDAYTRSAACSRSGNKSPIPPRAVFARGGRDRKGFCCGASVYARRGRRSLPDLACGLTHLYSNECVRSSGKTETETGNGKGKVHGTCGSSNATRSLGEE